MDGYSVQEAASVLGVAEGRVWELLARGVLLGTPEGDSMRVFLKAQPGPITAAPGVRDEPRTNGNGGSHAPEGEASAFRELLTEFRNLTERYGQALLALGEARGEVAGLRSRVDQLEARFDLRLPPPLDAAPVAWESTTMPAAPPPEPAVSPPRTAVPAPAVRRSSRSRKARSAREATAGFADALARAQDPSAAELGPSPAEPEVAAVAIEEPQPEAAQLATPQAADVDAQVVEPEAEPIDEGSVPVSAAAPIELEAVAEEVAVVVETEASADQTEPSVDSEAPTYSAVVVEPDWFADGDFAWLDAAEHEPPSASVPLPAAEMEEPSDEPVAVAEAAVREAEVEEAGELELEPEPGPIDEFEAAPPPSPEVLDEQELPLPPLPDPVPVPVMEAEMPYQPWQVPEAGASEVSAAPGSTGAADEPAAPDRGAAEGPETQVTGSAVALQDLEEEVMWLGADPTPIAQDEPLPVIVTEAEPWPAIDAAPASTDVARPPLAMTEDELARLALDEGWDEAEVAAIRAMITPVPSARVDLPGAAELHEAMAALEAVPIRVDPVANPSRQWAKPTSPSEGPFHQDDWAFEAEPTLRSADAPTPPADVTSALRRNAADPGWLRRRQGPAAAAYRRLRRLLPG
jgi:hypothetical protein